MLGIEPTQTMLRSGRSTHQARVTQLDNKYIAYCLLLSPSWDPEPSSAFRDRASPWYEVIKYKTPSRVDSKTSDLCFPSQNI